MMLKSETGKKMLLNYRGIVLMNNQNLAIQKRKN